jgi:hypothetical protein
LFQKYTILHIHVYVNSVILVELINQTMKKHHYVITLLLLIFNQSFSQSRQKLVVQDLPQYVIVDFAKAVNYSWYHANNKDAFKGAIIPRLQQKGIVSPFDIERTIQDVGKNKKCRDLVLNALSDYIEGTGITLNQLLANMGISPRNASILSSYEIQLADNNAEQIGDLLPAKRNYTVIGENVELKKLPKNWIWPSDYYCSYGTKVIAIRQDQEYLFCETIDPKTKKIMKGWVDSTLLQTDNGQVIMPVQSNTNSGLVQLMKYDGLGSNQEDENGITFLKSPVTASELKRIMASDYNGFAPRLSEGIGKVQVKNKVVYATISTFNPRIFGCIIIDVLNQKSYLCIRTETGYNKYGTKYYGDETLANNVIMVINRKLSEDDNIKLTSNFEDDQKSAVAETDLLNGFLIKHNRSN